MTRPDGDVDAARQDRFLTAAQLMEILSISENSCYFALRHGSLKSIAFRVGRQWRVREADLRLLAGKFD